MHTISEKLDCLVATVQLICNSVMNYVTSTAERTPENKKDLTVSADDLLPMLVYVLLQTMVPHLYSELRFIMDFGSHEAITSGQSGYCVSMLEGAMVPFRI